MTGRYPARTPVGLMEPLIGTKADSAFGLTADYPSVATVMKSAGYQTALIGKWHLGLQAKHSPLKNGFNYFFGIRGPAADYISHTGGGRQHDLFENEEPVFTEGYVTDLLSQKAAAFIHQEHKKPFFLTLTFNAPHWPWQGPGDEPYNDTVSFKKGGSLATYAAMMKSLDEGIGLVMKALDDAGLSNETLVIFTNDNGGERYSSHGGLSKEKGTLWEGGIRIPAFVRWPKRIAAGGTTRQVAVTMDWTAKILSAADARDDKRFPSDGLNLLPLLTGKKKEVERILYWRSFQRTKQKALRQGRWKFLQDEQGDYLFNLEADQGEKNNLKETEAAVFLRLKKSFAAWEKTVLLPLALGIDVIK